MGKVWKWILGALALFVVLGTLGNALSGGSAGVRETSSDPLAVASPAVVPPTAEVAPVAPAETPAPQPAITPAPMPQPVYVAPAPTPEPYVAPTPEARGPLANATRSAERYLSYMGFSREGLIKQLEFEEYPSDVATQAVDGLGADWNAEAAEKAASYLEYTSFSRSGLVDQLLFEGFTAEQAEYGVSQTYGG